MKSQKSSKNGREKGRRQAGVRYLLKEKSLVPTDGTKKPERKKKMNQKWEQTILVGSTHGR